MTSDVELFKLDPNCSVSVSEWQSSPSLESIVDEIWRVETKLDTHLFNGKIFTLLDWTPKHITGAFCDYKYFVAAKRDPDIEKALQLRPLGVSGILQSKDYVLIGRRALNMFTRPGFYELCPSGSIDPSAQRGGIIDLNRQLQIELEEETGIMFSEIQDKQVVSLVRTKSDGIWDIVIRCRLADSYSTQSIMPTAEYSEFFWQDIKRPLPDLNFVPLTKVFLSQQLLF